MDDGGEILRPYHKFKFDPKTALRVFERQFIQQRLFPTNSLFHLLVPTHEFLLASKLRWMLLAFDFRFSASWRLVPHGVYDASCGGS